MPSVLVDGVSVVVKPEAARRQFNAEASEPDAEPTPKPEPGPDGGPVPAPDEEALVRRFFGVKTLDSQRVSRDADQVAAEVINHLVGLVDADVEVKLEITANVPSGGVCGMPPCPTITLQLVDAARGLAAYILSGKLHLLRLRDGRDKVVATASDARFGDTGLFYAYTAAAPWVSRIRFVRWASLPLRP